MKYPRTADKARTIRSRASRRKKARSPLSDVPREAEESPVFRFRERQTPAFVDLPLTHRYSPESFVTVAEHGHH